MPETAVLSGRFDDKRRSPARTAAGAFAFSGGLLQAGFGVLLLNAGGLGCFVPASRSIAGCAALYAALGPVWISAGAIALTVSAFLFRGSEHRAAGGIAIIGTAIAAFVGSFAVDGTSVAVLSAVLSFASIAGGALALRGASPAKG